MDPEAVESLVAWFRQTVVQVPYGEVGIIVTKHEGQITTTRRIHNETHRLEPRNLDKQ